MVQGSPADPGQEGGVKAFPQAAKGPAGGCVVMISPGKGEDPVQPQPQASFPRGHSGPPVTDTEAGLGSDCVPATLSAPSGLRVRPLGERMSE